ncbi:MAG: bifunctional hydroxymethylpyrimidine kinase/phosphomethylpyrimidine kinase [Candidatus Methanomethylicus sp.]|nr:bifunctional hydroxymethylpyrimidine kinase/phosphomethylpyrimidine kinase [Candidatus Methanomethylicus sp.]
MVLKPTFSGIPTALTIAGSDSGGGAGIEADIKTFAALGVHGMASITALTAQNTTGVSGIYEIPVEFIRKQIDAVASDIGIANAKSGMLYSPNIVREVARAVREYEFSLVVDPVMISKSGASLLQKQAIATLKSDLLPHAQVVTPNLEEAELLSGIRITTLKDSMLAGKEILALGVPAVIIKGGHLAGPPVDVLCRRGSEPIIFQGPRYGSEASHGTGCTFSAAITALLAKGSSLEDATRRAKEFVANAIQFGFKIGKGIGPVNPTSNISIDAERMKIIENMADALTLIESSNSLGSLSPECQINIAMALPKQYTTGLDSVCAIPGRIFNVSGKLKAAACPMFGASKHVAKIVLTAMEYEMEMRSAMNIRWSEEIMAACKKAGLRISSYEREKEPPEVKMMEGASVPWGVRQAIQTFGGVPDIIYHMGDMGKEPMINILGKDAVSTAMKAIQIGRLVESP